VFCKNCNLPMPRSYSMCSGCNAPLHSEWPQEKSVN
jgi:RNA polymerase subunit RPABC4/transcription elongation factor Spt4